MAVHIDFGSILIMLTTVLILAKAASAVFNRFGVPGLIGEILIGILIANLAIGDWNMMDALGLSGVYTDAAGNAVPTTNRAVLDTLSEIGVIFLLFAVGLETRVKELMSVGKAAFLVALMGVVTPLVMGYAFIMIRDGDTMHALFMGAAMVATSVGITARVIKDLGLTDTKEAKTIIGAAVIDDVMGMMILAVVVGMAKNPSGGIDLVDTMIISVSAVVFVLAVILFCMKGLPKINGYMDARKRMRQEAHPEEIPASFNKLSVAVIVCLALAFLANWIGLAAIIGAFLAGMLFADRAIEWDLHEKFESLNVFLVSFFFVTVGLRVEIGAFTSEVLVVGLAVVIIAIISKYFACSAGARMGDRTTDRTSARIVGLGMIPRGEVGIIVASLGLTYYAITAELYAVVVMMSIVTTLTAPLFLSRAFRKKYTPEYFMTADDKI